MNSKTKPEVIKVTFPDGEEICYQHPVSTVIEVLRKIGEARFPEIDLEIAKHRIVSQELVPELRKYTKEITTGWYYINRTDTREKTAQLININRVLNLGLKIEVGYFKANNDPHIERISRKKNRIIVTMPNGEIIDYESYKDVFVTVIDRIGPRRISSRANFDLNGNQPLLTTTDTNGSRVQVAEALFLAYPRTAIDSKKFLELIAKRLCIYNSMKFEIV